MEQNNLVKAFPLYVDTNGCDYHRIKLPFKWGVGLFNEQYDRKFSPDPDLLWWFLNNCQVVAFNRGFHLGYDRAKQLKAAGIKLAMDLDDWVELPNYHPLYQQYKEWGAKNIIDHLKLADLVTVTTDRLYQKVKEFNINCHVIPNALPFGRDQFKVGEADKSGLFRFGYTGQSSHLEDVRIMMPSMYKVRKLKDIAFKLSGYKDHAVWVGMEAVFKSIPNYTRQNAVPLDEYMTVYDDMHCSVVPLCYNDFNSCKSNLKLLEAAAKKIPCIVSHVPPYRDDPDAPVLWVQNSNDWYKHMKYLSENRDAAVDMGEALNEWAIQKYSLDHWNKVRFQLYQSLV